MTDPLRPLYEQSATFGRDFFHYIVAATVFVLASTAGVVAAHGFGDATVGELKQLSTLVTSTLLVLGVVLLYAIGHVLLAIGFVLDQAWLSVFKKCSHVASYARAKTNTETITELILKERENPIADREDYHLVAEMVILNKVPEIHARFLERYNTLVHLRLNLATSLGLAAIVTGAHLLVNCTWQVVVLTSILFLLAVLVQRQVVISRTRFLDRLAVATLVACEIDA